MKKMFKVGIGITACSAFFLGTALVGNRVFAKENEGNTISLCSDCSPKSLKVSDKEKVLGYDVYDGGYTSEGRSYGIKYSDGFFKYNPACYQPHMATLALGLSHASSTYIDNGNYSNGAKTVKEALTSIGFNNIYVSDSYNQKPKEDSVACAIAQKKLTIDSKQKMVVSITVRSANYESEWANNVTLGSEGEAKGFSESASKVVDYFKQYLQKNDELKSNLEKGNVDFFLQGYSRGGAIANIASKALIDNYQEKGNQVYAYCIEAPAAGKAEMLKDNVDYRGIHNVINPNDFVCYVAPANMGFTRYGVDHFLGGSLADYHNLDNIGTHNNPCDNKYLVEKYDENKVKVINHIQAVTGKTECVPYEIKHKELDGGSFAIKDLKRDENTANFIKNFISNFSKNITRDTYSTAIEPAVRNLMKFINTGADFKKLMPKNVSMVDLGLKVVSAFTSEASKSGTNLGTALIQVWNFIKGSGNTQDLTPEIRQMLASSIRTVLLSNEEAKKVLMEYYPTKESGASEDLCTILNWALSGSLTFNDIITFALNAKDLINNHTFEQTLGWLRIEDCWYDNTASDTITI